MYPPPPSAREVQPTAKRSKLSNDLDALPVWTKENDASLWVEVAEGSNHVPGQIAYAKRRNPGRRFVWEYDDIGVRVWRMK